MIPPDAKPIPGFVGYWVTPAGTVWSTRMRRPRALVPYLSHGYPRVGLLGDGRRTASGQLRPRGAMVHALVLLTFVGPRPNGLEARHLDGNRGNPALSNLAWGTSLENANDKRRHGTAVRGERTGTAKLTAEQTAALVRAAAGGVPQRALARRFGIGQTQVGRIIRGEAWTHVNATRFCMGSRCGAADRAATLARVR